MDGGSLHHSSFIQASRTLVILHSIVLAQGVLTLLTRIFAVRLGLPLKPVHVTFLLLILAQSSLRIADLDLSPRMVPPGATAGLKAVYTRFAGVLGLAPSMLGFMIYTQLMYHVVVVLRAIHLAYAPFLYPQRQQTQDMLIGSGGATPVRITPTAVSVSSVHPNSPSQDTLLGLSRSILSRRRRCARYCDFWLFCCGRPHSAFKVAIVFLNLALWMSILAAKAAEYHGWSHMASAMTFTAFVGMAFVMGVIFVAFGVVLIVRLRMLQRVASEVAAYGCSRPPAAPHGHEMPARRPSSTSDVAENAARALRAAREAEGARGGMSPGTPHRFPRPGSWSEGDRADKSSGRRPLVLEGPASSTPQSPRSEPLHGPARPSSEAGKSPMMTASQGSMGEAPASSFDLRVITDPATVAAMLVGMQRMLAVVAVCTLAFLFRGCVAAYLYFGSRGCWPTSVLFFAYFLLGELLPSFLLLILYFLPGVQTVHLWYRGVRFTLPTSVPADNASCRQSMLEGGTFVGSEGGSSVQGARVLTPRGQSP